LGHGDRRIAWAHEFKTSLGNIVRPHLKTKQKDQVYVLRLRQKMEKDMLLLGWL
jgi:hypothetical protein